MIPRRHPATGPQLLTPVPVQLLGHAVGAGINLMLATDLRIVARDARLISGFLRILPSDQVEERAAELARRPARDPELARKGHGQPPDRARTAPAALGGGP